MDVDWEEEGGLAINDTRPVAVVMKVLILLVELRPLLVRWLHPSSVLLCIQGRLVGEGVITAIDLLNS